MATKPMAGMVFLVGLALLVPALLVWLWRRGVFSEGAFGGHVDRCPALGPHDALTAVGLWLVGASASSLIGGAPDAPWRPLAAQAVVYGPILLYLWVRWRSDRRIGSLGFSPTRVAVRRAALALVTVVPLQMFAGMLVAAVLAAAGREQGAVGHRLLAAVLADPTAVRVALLLVSAVVVAPIVEEVLFRGILQTVLVRTVGGHRWRGIVACSVLFAAIHAGAATVPDGDMSEQEASPMAVAQADDVRPAASLNWPALAVIFVFSLGLGYAYEAARSLWAPVLMHAAFNAANIAWVWYAAGVGGPAP